MSPDDLRAFARRDWARVERAKREYWQREYAARGARPSLEAADALLKHVRRFAPQNESEARELDYAHHVTLKRRIDAANRRLRR